MTSDRSSTRRVVVVGGGIAGLAAAHRIMELDPARDVTLVESSGRLGGVLRTSRRDGFLLEASADSFITNVPWTTDLCRRLGLAPQLISTNEEHRRAYVVRRGRLRHVPAGFLLMAPSRVWPVLSTPVLSLRGKLRLMGEYFVPPRREAGDESLASFCRRRLGRETFDRLIQPLIGGIYTADPERLSMAATMPRFLELERRHGSLLAAMLDGALEHGSSDTAGSGARYSLFVTLREGLGQLVDALAARLPAGAVRLNWPAGRIARDGEGWKIERADGGETLTAGAVMVAAPAPRAAALLQGVDAELAGELGRIEYAGCAVVTCAYRRDQIGRRLDGFGVVVPAVERRRILAVSFSSIKFAGRAPEDCLLMRVFVGGACQPRLGELPDEDLRRLVDEELAELLSVTGRPLFTEIDRWQGAMPQYHLGHCERVRQIERRVDKLPGLELAGNAYHGVGIPHCIHSGETAAERVVAGR